MLIEQISQIDFLTLEEEIALFRRWKAGEIMAKVEIMRRYLPFVLRVCRRYSQYRLEELIGAGVCGLHKAIDAPAYDPLRKPLWKVAFFQVNDAIKDYIRRDRLIYIPREFKAGSEVLKADRRRAMNIASLNLPDSFIPKTGDAIAGIELSDCLDELPSNLNLVVIRRLQGYTLDEIGLELGVTKQTVCKWFHRAIEQLREIIKVEHDA